MNKGLLPISIMVILAITITIFGVMAFNMKTRVNKIAYRTNLLKLQQIVNNGDKKTTEEIFESIELIKKCVVEKRFWKEEPEIITAWLQMICLYDFELANSVAQNILMKHNCPAFSKGDYEVINEISEEFRQHIHK